MTRREIGRTKKKLHYLRQVLLQEILKYCHFNNKRKPDVAGG